MNERKEGRKKWHKDKARHYDIKRREKGSPL